MDLLTAEVCTGKVTLALEKRKSPSCLLSLACVCAGTSPWQGDLPRSNPAPWQKCPCVMGTRSCSLGCVGAQFWVEPNQFSAGFVTPRGISRLKRFFISRYPLGDSDFVPSLPASLLLGEASFAGLSLGSSLSFLCSAVRCNSFFSLLDSSLYLEKAAKKRSRCWRQVSVFAYWIDLQGVLMGRRLVTRSPGREVPMAMQECSLQKVLEHTVSSECGGVELFGEQLLQSCSHPSCPV